jgi:hypothetical protein
MGIRLGNNHIARFVALPFGASQAPALFTQLANKFARLLRITFAQHNLTKTILCVYIDDILIATPTHNELQQACQIMNSLATDLGIEFKTSKYVGIDTPTQQLEFLGI